MEEAEATIKRERVDVDRRRAREDEDERSRLDSLAEERANTDHPQLSRSSFDVQRESRDDDPDMDMGIDGSVNPSPRHHETTNMRAPDHDDERRDSDATAQDGGDVIEAGEDAVIY